VKKITFGQQEVQEAMEALRGPSWRKDAFNIGKEKANREKRKMKMLQTHKKPIQNPRAQIIEEMSSC
jgi:hypothetical protein